MKLLKWIKSKRKKAHKQPPQEAARDNNAEHDTSIPTKLTPNEQLVAELYRCTKAKEELTHLFHPDADIMFKEAPMTLSGFHEEMTRIFESFPDFELGVLKRIKEQPDGKVEATLVATGTHTGKPYSFGPFPEIASTGIAIKLDPEKCVYTVKDGKITRLETTPMGEATGPPGIYTQLGGLIF